MSDLHEGRVDEKRAHRGPYAAVFFNQSIAGMFVDLAGETAKAMGPVLVHTGTKLKSVPRGVTVWTAPAYDNSSLKSRARTWAAYMARATVDAARIRGEKPVVFLASNPPMLPALGLALNLVRGWPYVVQVLDVYPDVLVSQGLVGENNPGVHAFGALDRAVYARAHAVTTLGPVMAETLAKYMPAGVNAQVFRTWTDVGAMTPRPKEENWFAKEHGLVEPLVVMYSGNLGLTHDLGGLFEAARLLEGEEAEGKRAVRLLVVGNAERLKEQDPSLAQRKSVRFLPFQPEEVVPYSLSAADVGVVALGKGIAGISMPSKTYPLMAAGCAVLGVGFGGDDVQRVIEEHRCGLYARADRPEEIAAAIRRFREDPEFLGECKRNARAAAERHFDALTCIGRHVGLFREAVNGG